MKPTGSLGFIGLGVMGEPMCRNLVRTSGCSVIAFDLNQAPLDRLAFDGVMVAASLRDIAAIADVIILSLPGGPQVEQVVRGSGDTTDGLLAYLRPGQTVIDTTTAPVDVERNLSDELAKQGVAYADAPIARTRQAAHDGTLSITVGAAPEVFARIQPILACIGSDVLHCGPVGCGQVVKLMNNMVLFQTVIAIAEAMTIGAKAGVNEELLLKALGNGSADSFALRNHALKAMLPRDFPEAAFSTDYALKDIGYALDLAGQIGVDPLGARLARDTLRRSSEAGHGENYFPALLKLISREQRPK